MSRITAEYYETFGIPLPEYIEPKPTLEQLAVGTPFEGLFKGNEVK
jgi:hypothetical protein